MTTKNQISKALIVTDLANFHKGAWASKFKSEPDYYKVLDAYRNLAVGCKAYAVAIEVVADASENMSTDLVAIYQESASKTLDKMIDAAAYLVAKVGTDELDTEANQRLAKWMNHDCVQMYNRVIELKNANA